MFANCSNSLSKLPLIIYDKAVTRCSISGESGVSLIGKSIVGECKTWSQTEPDLRPGEAQVHRHKILLSLLNFAKKV